MHPLVDIIKERQIEIHHWLQKYENSKELPLYTSVDIRNAGFKMAVVDTNLFPAGFNNLCEHGISDSIIFMRKAILERSAECRNILIIAEEHTRNTWYLENIRILQEIITKAGFNAQIATFLYVQPAFCADAQMNHIELKTATGNTVEISCLQRILEEIKNGSASFDLIILNNDLTTGIPDVLKDAHIPIYPSLQAGWHSRLKSHHFKHTADLINEFSRIIDLDPWLFSCVSRTVDNVDINSEHDRITMHNSADDLFGEIQKKYDEHGIREKPYIVVKADSGTYGMGVMVVEDPHEIIALNRKGRNRLHKGKSAQVITRYLLQEGVPTIDNIDEEVSEVVAYQIANLLVGGFYRSHAGKSNRQNLNAQGMEFKQMCPHLRKYGDCGVHHDVNIFDVYRILARIAGVAAHREIIQLEATHK